MLGVKHDATLMIIRYLHHLHTLNKPHGVQYFPTFHRLTDVSFMPTRVLFEASTSPNALSLCICSSPAHFTLSFLMHVHCIHGTFNSFYLLILMVHYFIIGFLVCFPGLAWLSQKSSYSTTHTTSPFGINLEFNDLSSHLTIGLVVRPPSPGLFVGLSSTL